MLDYRRLMETYLGRKLSHQEVVHHKNGNREDNRLENLEVLTHSEHSKKHYIQGDLHAIGQKTSTSFKFGHKPYIGKHKDHLLSSHKMWCSKHQMLHYRKIYCLSCRYPNNERLNNLILLASKDKTNKVLLEKINQIRNFENRVRNKPKRPHHNLEWLSFMIKEGATNTYIALISGVTSVAIGLYIKRNLPIKI